MTLLLEMYKGLLDKIDAINANVEMAKKRISAIDKDYANDIPQRIENLEEQLEKIDDYALKIEAFRKLAEKNIESKNVLTIEAPPGYRVNLNRLRQWAMLIDPTSSDDPYAQRVYLVAKCDECFLEKKRVEFTGRVEALKRELETGLSEEMERLEAEIASYNEDYSLVLSGYDMEEFAEEVKKANSSYWYETAPGAYSCVQNIASYVAPGAYALPLDAPEASRPSLKRLFGKFYDEVGSRVLIPFELGTNKEFALSVLCSPSRSKFLDKALQNLILSIIEKYPAGQNKVYILDGVRFNSSVLGSLKQLEDSFAIEQIPRNPDQLSALLEKIVSGFSDIDDLMELSDSVIEYNEDKPLEQKIARSTLILFGWPNAYQGQDKEHLNRIMTNYERYGISFINIVYSNTKREEDGGLDLPGYAGLNAIKIKMAPKETTIKIGDHPLNRFTWYTLGEKLPPSYVESLRTVVVKKERVTNVYPERHDCVSLPRYERSYKKIELPFGIDGKGKEYSVSFENENFAAYLVGASRSGKSTLIHTLIAGIIRNYHPDNVELWLADFKQLEFKKYMEHCPPHVKYILLDESTELVYDLVDKLTEKMMERQRLFSRLGKERIDQIDPTQLDSPLPLIFVILDEFSIMSQSLFESDVYRLKLQNLLAKGAALGFRFLFSSQTFTSGVNGLTPTARAQIQQRIAMKGSKEEITETLELSANLKTEQVQNWIDALPPYYALVKYRKSADTLPEVIRVLVEYIPDYKLRDELIDRINSAMTAMESYQPSSVNSYVDKEAVLVDGNSYELYIQREIEQKMKKYFRTKSIYHDEIPLSLGRPRLMSELRPVIISKESRENLLLIGRSAEKMCVASVLTSMALGFLNKKKRVKVWAYGKNSLYRMCRDEVWNRADFDEIIYFEGLSAVSEAIRELKKKIVEKEVGDELIILMGLDRIYMDFDFIDQNALGQYQEFDMEKYVEDQQKNLVKRGAIASSKEDEEMSRAATKWNMERGRLKAQLLSQGRSLEEVDKALKEAKDAFFAPFKKAGNKAAEADAKTAAQKDDKQERAEEKKPYNPQQDFLYVVRQASRLGYHFAAVFNNASDFRNTNLRTDWFRHRLAFQLSVDDSVEVFGRKIASTLPPRICQYSDTLDSFSFRPYLHQGLAWDGWEVDENGTLISPY